MTPMTTSSQIPSPGDVVSVRFDFLDRTGAKLRPAVVLSQYQFNRSRGYFIFTPLTGSSGSFTDESLAEIQDIDQAGLNRRSYSHGILATANNRDIRRVIGNLSARDRTRVRRLVGEVISL